MDWANCGRKTASEASVLGYTLSDALSRTHDARTGRAIHHRYGTSFRASMLHLKRMTPQDILDNARNVEQFGRVCRRTLVWTCSLFKAAL